MRVFQISALCFAFVLASFGVLGSVVPVFACSCAEATLTEQSNNATAVFVGTVENISGSGGSRSVEFDVSESRKGSIGESVTVTTAANEAMCGYSFVEGQEYIVYAYGEADQLSTGLCTGTSGYVTNAVDENGDGDGATDAVNDSILVVCVVALVSFGAGVLMAYVVGKMRKMI